MMSRCMYVLLLGFARFRLYVQMYDARIFSSATSTSCPHCPIVLLYRVAGLSDCCNPRANVLGSRAPQREDTSAAEGLTRSKHPNWPLVHGLSAMTTRSGCCPMSRGDLAERS